MAKIAVVGDLMLDIDVYGKRRDVQEPVEFALIGPKPERYLGGAGNVAAVLRKLGHTVYLFALVGEDPHGVMLQIALSLMGIESFLSPQLPVTTTKIRVYEDRHILTRIDWEEQPKNTPGVPSTPLRMLQNNRLLRYDAVIYCDYNKGIFNQASWDTVQRSLNWGIPIIVAPKPTEYAPMWCGCDLVVLNAEEARAIGDIYPCTKMLLVTEGKNGASLTTQEPWQFLRSAPVLGVSNPQVVGAGDVVTAAATDALLRSQPPKEILNYTMQLAKEYVSMPRNEYWRIRDDQPGNSPDNSGVYPINPSGN